MSFSMSPRITSLLARPTKELMRETTSSRRSSPPTRIGNPRSVVHISRRGSITIDGSPLEESYRRAQVSPQRSRRAQASPQQRSRRNLSPAEAVANARAEYHRRALPSTLFGGGGYGDERTNAWVADALGAAPNGSFALERFLTTGQSSELVDALQRLLTLVEASAAGGQQR